MSALRDAYELIKDPEHWTTGRPGETADGTPVSSDCREAVRWCAQGAVYRCGNGSMDTIVPLSYLLNETAKTLFDRDLVFTNDVLGHEAVMQVFEKALVETEGSL